jgi:S-adenosylmethionine decarboxylase proenzyme
MKSLATHLLIELHDCDSNILNDSNQVKDIFIDAAKQGKATIVNDLFHEFSPHGLTGVLVITESHLSIHTWPEFNYAAVDVFSCDDKLNGDKIKQILEKEFNSKEVYTKIINRG